MCYLYLLSDIQVGNYLISKKMDSYKIEDIVDCSMNKLYIVL